MADKPVYDHLTLEKKWQNTWEKDKTFSCRVDRDKPKYYVLDMFPYPSGAGLHVGHPEGYTATDIISRYKRMKGFNVLHPMGWDSFGLPAENYAIKTGTHPDKVTRQNIATFKQQLKSLGFSYDWDREIATSSLDYYRWTQWIFTKLYNRGLAYEADIQVNWCPELKTVLANEEVVDGKSEVGGHPVVRKPMKQWMLRITEYAERLLADLDELDWPENIKTMQRNWIGRSEGARVTFQIEGHELALDVFTTRPDTLFGATYMVLSPEHEYVARISTAEQRDVVERYVRDAASKSDLERTDLNKDKSGVFSGAYAINPVNGERLPVWIADYVLISYGTGAIMAVPAHDQRDWDFARKYELPIIQVLDGGDISQAAFEGDGLHINSGILDGLGKADAVQTINDWLEKNGCGRREVNYKLRDWLFSRQRYWGEPFPILKFEDGTVRCLDEDELPVALPDVEQYEPSGTGESPLATIEDWLWLTDPKTGKKARRETNTMPQWAGSCWYYLRFCDPNNDSAAWSSDAESYWMPVDLYVGGTEHAVLHLLYARFWHKVLYDLGLVSTKEPFQRLVNQGMILGEDGEKMSKSRGNVINPDTVVQKYGADTLRLYEMFMGPLEKVKPWSTQGVKGVHNFLTRVYTFFADPARITDGGDETGDTLKTLHQTIKKVGDDIEALRFNTAISQMMIFTNHCIKAGSVQRETARTFMRLLSPFAPHLAEELWQSLGETQVLAYHPWPGYDDGLIVEDRVELVIQVNGKIRDKLEIAVNTPEEEVKKAALDADGVQKWVTGKSIRKVICVPNKLVNIVAV